MWRWEGGGLSAAVVATARRAWGRHRRAVAPPARPAAAINSRGGQPWWTAAVKTPQDARGRGRGGGGANPRQIFPSAIFSTLPNNVREAEV